MDIEKEEERNMTKTENWYLMDTIRKANIKCGVM